MLSLTLLVAGGIINYMDRGTLAVANVPIRQEMGVSLVQMGWLLSAFAWSYALAQLPVGAMVDRIGPRRLLGFGLVLWSLAQAAGGLVHSFTQFIPHASSWASARRHSSLRRARRQQLVPGPRARPADRHVQLGLSPGLRARAAVADAADRLSQLALDVRVDGCARSRHGRRLVRHVS